MTRCGGLAPYRRIAAVSVRQVFILAMILTGAHFKIISQMFHCSEWEREEEYKLKWPHNLIGLLQLACLAFLTTHDAALSPSCENQRGVS